MKKTVLFWLFFVIAFLAVPYDQLNHLQMMPGDLGDARLNNYFLENIYQFFYGGSPSLIHFNFFYPFPYVQGFSDNLYGSFPAYLIPRVLTGHADTAYQIWYLFGFLANYAAAYFALRKLHASAIAAVVGALIFAFAIPVTAHSSFHAQLHYRFGVPLAITMFIMFLEHLDWRYFAMSMSWLAWQFYCTIYIGFFLCLMLAAMFCVYVYRSSRAGTGGIKAICTNLFSSFSSLAQSEKIKLIAIFLILAFLMGLLFYPYLQVSVLYDAKRHWGEIATMLPRPQSYFIADYSVLWKSQAENFADIPMRHEHQMFIGAVPLVLAVCGVFAGLRHDKDLAFPLLSGALLLLILLTLFVSGFSLWYLLAKLPLASAMRAMTRIVLVLVFPVAFLSAVSIDWLKEQVKWQYKILVIIIVSLMVFEFATNDLEVTAKTEWRNRLLASEKNIPAMLPKNPILFYAQSAKMFYEDELDSVWAALDYGIPTLNGYSGLYPPGYSVEFGNDCSELPKRILSYLNFSGQAGNAEAYFSLLRRMVPIGFSGCKPEWWVNAPTYTRSERQYTADELKGLSYEYLGRVRSAGKEYADLRIKNDGELRISANSAHDKSIRLSWRFTDAAGNALSGWNTRKDLPFDIPAKGSLDVRIAVDAGLARNAEKLQVTIVQEHVFFGVDVGIPPLEIEWKSK